MDRVTGHTRITDVMKHFTVTGSIYQECPDHLVIYGTVGNEPPRDYLFMRTSLTSVERNIEVSA